MQTKNMLDQASDLHGALKQAIQNHQADNLKQAASGYRQVIQMNPKHADAVELLGIVTLQMGKTAKALNYLKRAVKIDQGSGYFYANLARVYGMTGRFQDRDIAYDKARDLLPPMTDPTETLFVGLLSSEALKLEKYQKNVEQLRSSTYLQYPRHVHLETYALCNAICDFCPYTEIARKGTRMEDALIEKIITDLEDIPKDVDFQLSPFKLNEPFLDVRLFDTIKNINDRLSNATITITSNASPITEKNLARLAQVERLEYLWISANDHRKKEYEEVMGISYERTKKRLETIHQWKKDDRFTPPVVLSRVGDGTSADEDFITWVQENYPLFNFNVTRRGDWLGQVETNAFPVPDVGCMRWFDIVITATGDVSHCVMDGKTEYPLGNVRDQHVLEVYNAPQYRSLREKASSRLGKTPCGQCGFI